jgi:hypothetical protein
MGNSDRADDMENIVERYGNSPDRMRRAAPLSGSAQHASSRPRPVAVGGCAITRTRADAVRDQSRIESGFAPI